MKVESISVSELQPFLKWVELIRDLKVRMTLFEESQELDDVHFSRGWQEDDDKTISSFYKPKDKLVKKCSICGMEKHIFVIEGVQLISPKNGDTIRKGIYHTTFHLICESCCVAREI